MVEDGNLHLSRERKDGTGGKWGKEQVEARVETVMDEKQKQAERGKEQSGKSHVPHCTASKQLPKSQTNSPRDRQDKVLEQDFSPAPCNTTAKLAPLLHFASDKDKQKQKEGNKELKKEKDGE